MLQLYLRLCCCFQCGARVAGQPHTGQFYDERARDPIPDVQSQILQDMLAPLGGPVIDGPYGKYNDDVCDFDTMRNAVQRGQSGTGPYVLEASKGGCTPDSSCIAAYLLAATEYTYLGCLADEPQLPYYPDLARPLGKPLGDAKLGDDGVWSREFTFGAVARWYPDAKKGTVQWRGDPIPNPPPSMNVSRYCGTALLDTTLAQDDVAAPASAATPQACCDLCRAVPASNKNGACVAWAWHGEESPPMCHLHGANSSKPKTQSGTVTGFMRSKNI